MTATGANVRKAVLNAECRDVANGGLGSISTGVVCVRPGAVTHGYPCRNDKGHLLDAYTFGP